MNSIERKLYDSREEKINSERFFARQELQNRDRFVQMQAEQNPLPVPQLRRKFTATQLLTNETQTGRSPQQLGQLHPPLQAKLAIGQVGDRYEREADCVARNVVQHLNSPRGEHFQPTEASVQMRPQLQRSGNFIPTQPAIVQRDISQEEQDISDEDFNYGTRKDGTDFTESDLNQKVVLKKEKPLYTTKGGWTNVTKNNENVVLKKGQLVEVLEEPSKDIFRYWAKVKASGKEGWINTNKSVKAPESKQIAKHESAGIIMPNGKPTVNDVKQMMFGDCFLLAALMSLVQKQPNFIKKELFQTDPTKNLYSHTVRFFKIKRDYSNHSSLPYKFIPENVKIKNSILKLKTDIETSSITVQKGTNVGSAGIQAWPAIIEKAFALWPGTNESDTVTHDKLTGLVEGGEVDRASMFLMGQTYERIYTSGDTYPYMTPEQEEEVHNKHRGELKEKIIAALSENNSTLVGAGTKDEAPKEWLKANQQDGRGGSGETKVGGIAFGHAYSIVKADKNEIQLRNPWGRYSRVRGKIEEDEAVSILTWDEFFQTFGRVSLAV